MNGVSQNSIRKAAVLLSTLDDSNAEALLAKMPSETAELVRLTAADLADVSAEEQEAVIREFMAAGGGGNEESFDGVELAPSLANKLHSPEGYSEPAASAPQAPPFRFLQQATADVLARHLERQHPQVIAVVTAHLPPQQAADVVKRFKPKLQSEVLRRVAQLDIADQEILQDIERELELLLSDDLRLARNRETGLATVSTILNAAGTHRKELLHNLSEHERELATQLTGIANPLPKAIRSAIGPQGPAKRPVTAKVAPVRDEPPLVNRTTESIAMDRGSESHVPSPSIAEPSASVSPARDVDFEELTMLGDDDWAVLIRSVEPSLVLLALTGASEQLLQRITQRLSKREAQALRNRLEQTGPLRLSDIEHAQRNVANLASRLAARGEIQLPERRGFAAAA